MKILPIQDVYARKFERQRKIDQLEYHAAGHCVHLGKISPGCYSCFVADRYGKNIVTGIGCNRDCDYCASGSGTSNYGKHKKSAKEEEMENLSRFHADREALINDSKMPDYNPRKMSFSGGGEPLMYIDNISMYMELFHDLHRNLEQKPWYFLYTNGTQATKKNLERLKALGINEIRFHIGATDFSERVYENMRTAVKYIGTISVETPAWPLHREKLFQMLPIIQDIGVKHLNITEIELNNSNFNKISEILPEGEICQCGELQLYDNGLVYDLMEEVVQRGYTFSVLDCNCFVKSIQRTPGKWLCHETVDGLCAETHDGSLPSTTSHKDPEKPSALRDEYFRFFDKNGVKYPASGNISKPAIGSLSPGCRTCIAGTWCCLYVTGACTRECFFCPSTPRESLRYKQPEVPESLSFGSIHGFLEYLEKFDFEGVSFSGGEPFLALDTVLEYIKGIRRWFGDKHYIWAYTNGDLVTEERLSLLKQAGLNELRFDIAANNYDLTAVEKAIAYIDTVTVEIPAIPEDNENLKSLLKEMKRIGVKHLNLHQLMKSADNAENLNQRGYSAANEDVYPTNPPIVESELAALEILKHAIETESALPINYCSRCYKGRFQGMAHRKRAAQFFNDKKIGQTETGYLRKVAIDASPEEAAIIKKHVDEAEWEITVEGGKPELILPLDYFDVLLTENFIKADVIYYEPVLAPASNVTGIEISSEIFAGNNVCSYKNLRFRKTLGNRTSAFLFKKLFIEKKNIENAAKELSTFHESNGDNAGETIQDIVEFYEEFQEAEYLPRYLEPYDHVPKSGIAPKQTPGIQVETFADGLLLCHPASTEAIHLNSSAAAIWELCDGENSTADIENVLKNAYPDGENRIQTDIDSVLEKLQEINVIEFHFS